MSEKHTIRISCGPCGCIILIVMLVAMALGLTQMIGFVFGA